MQNPIYLWSAIFIGSSLIFWRLLRHIMPDKSTFLEALSFEWKSGKDIRSELNRRHDGIISFFAFQLVMKILVHDGLVDCRPIRSFPHDIIEDFEYRRASESYGSRMISPRKPPQQSIPIPTPHKTATLRSRSFFVDKYDIDNTP